jgi:ABC-2 type transport system permease protein
MNLRRTLAMARKEILHILRDVRSLLAAIAQPILMLVLFGYALSLDVDHVPTIIYDLDRTPQSRALIDEFRGSPYFEIVEIASSYRPIERGMDTRKAMLGVVIPYNYTEDFLSGKQTDVQLLLDGSDSNTAAIAIGYAEGVVQTYAARARIDAQIQRTGAAIHPVIDARPRVWYNTDLVSKDYIVPGLIGVIIMIIAALLTSLTVAREWENGTMEQLLSTPVRPVEIAFGKLAAYFLLGFIDLIIALVVGIYIFDVPFKGNPFLLMFSSCVFLVGALGWGIMISAMNRNQLAAYQLSTFTSFLPAFLLSGFIYSIQNMPLLIRGISLFVPARYFINIVKGIFLKGVGLEVLWFDLLLLVLYALFVLRMATKKLRQKVG